MISMAGFAFGADPKPQTNSNNEPQPDEVRRLESVTWDLKTHTLSWVVQKGTEKNGEFVSSGSQRYEVTPDTAKMSVAAEQRGLEQEEAALLHRLLDTLSIYCAQSVVWWDHAESGPELSNPEGTPSLKPERPTKGDEPRERPTPVKPVKVLPLGVAEVAAHPKVQ